MQESKAAPVPRQSKYALPKATLPVISEMHEVQTAESAKISELTEEEKITILMMRLAAKDTAHNRHISK